MNIIRPADTKDLEAILSIYESARLFMRKSGNMTQWSGGYPSREVVNADIVKKSLYVCENDGAMLGVFYYALENDITYGTIYDGAWLNGLPYAVIHRIAISDAARGKGVAGFIFNYCFEQHPNIKIDTHKDNIPMQRALEKNGFKRCGIIHLLNGEERIAFQREE